MVFLMARLFHFPDHHLLLFLLLLSLHHSNQLQPSQSQAIAAILQLINYPSSSLTSFEDNRDFCSSEPTSYLTLTCYEDDLTQLHIVGGNGVPPLPENFSIDSFFSAIAALPSLKVLSLVSLGLRGSLPATVGQLSSVEILNVSSNHITGDIPVQLFSLRKLQTLILDHNRFTGQVPVWVGSFPVLAFLSLKNNSLSGSLPDSISNMENLRVLSLSRNNLFGEVPDLHNLANLQVLDLENNYFGPHFPSLPNKLVTLVLRNNSFRFGISAELLSNYQLQKLDMSLNGFVGRLSPLLLSLPSLTYIDVSHNKFTGMLFENMTCNAELVYVDLSSNFLIGELPNCLKSPSKKGFVMYAGNCLSNQEQEQHPSNFCHIEALAVNVTPHNEDKHNRPYGKAVLASSSAGGAVGVITIVGMIVVAVRKAYSRNDERKPQTRLITENASTVNTVKLLSDARHISETMKLGASLPAYRTFTLEELKETTNNFDAKNILFEDSNYQIFKGKLANGALVAIRSLKGRKHQSQQALVHRIELVSKLRHSYLVSALGHCFNPEQCDSSISKVFFIFEFTPNGTLRDHISGKKLNWEQRIGAAIGVAKGVQFLHTGIFPGLFSNNLKITDILLDHDLRVKVSCYNLPLLDENGGKPSQVIASFSSPKSNQKFFPRERCEDKEDVHDCGVILLEILSGRPITSQNEVIVLKDLLRVSLTVETAAQRSIVDPAIQKECSDESLKIVMEICNRCLSSEPSDRPSVEDVLWNLQFAAQVQDSWKGNSLNNLPESLAPSTFQV